MPDALAPPPRRIGRKVLIGVGLLGIFYVAGAARQPRALLPPDCTTPAFKLAADTVAAHKVMSYTVVGPADRWLVLGIDTARLDRTPDGGWQGVPLPGHTEFQLGGSFKGVKGCRRTGRFGIPSLGVGTHVVTLYDVTDGTAREVAHRTFGITEH